MLRASAASANNDGSVTEPLRNSRVLTLKNITVRGLAAPLAILAMTASEPLHAQVAGCLPSCDVTDAKLLNLSGDALSTLSGGRVELSIVVVPGAESFSFGIFDGDTGGLWDDETLAMDYVLYADPNRDGTDRIEVARYSGNDMLDDAWSDFVVSVTENARDALGTGHAFYLLEVVNPDPMAPAVSNGFKVRVTDVGIATLVMRPQAFAIEPVFSSEELFKVFPDFPDLSTATYDGGFSFALNLPDPLGIDPLSGQRGEFFVVWDGDLDHGSADCSLSHDDNDPNTPDNLIPPWATGTAVNPEGVAITTIPCLDGTSGPSGEGYATGNPPDDISNGGIEMTPSVYYSVLAPDGQVFVNANPSGNQEWEQFRIGGGDESVPDVADANVIGSLAAGTWRVEVQGLDLSNFASFRFMTDLVCLTESGDACPAPVPPPATVEEPGPSEDCACDGKVDSLALRYTGSEVGADLYVTDKRSGRAVYVDSVSSGDSVLLDGAELDIDKKNTLGPEIRVYLNGRLAASIHTSCSEPIGPGMQFGDFLVVAGTSRNNGPLCTISDEGSVVDSEKPYCKPGDETQVRKHTHRGDKTGRKKKGEAHGRWR